MRVRTEFLRSAIQPLGAIVSKNTVLPICESVLFTDKGIMGTDLERTLFVPFPIKDVPEPFAVNYKDLVSALDAMDGTYTEITVNEGCYSIAFKDTEGTQINIPAESGEQFPGIPEIGEQIGKFICPAIKDFTRFSSTDELKPGMNGVNIQTGVICATDAHILRVSERAEISLPDLCITIPNNVAELIKTDCQVNVYEHNGEIVFPNRSVLTFRLIDDRFPQFRGVIPERESCTTHLQVDRLELIARIKSMDRFLNPATKRVVFDLQSLKLSSENIDTCVEINKPLPGKVLKSDFEKLDKIAVNAMYLLKILTDIKGSEVVFEMSTPNRALTMYSGNDCYLVMPVMLPPELEVDTDTDTDTDSELDTEE